mmetsp:Transcript_317/g.877  ORF Transcript_317/g.877 Transcript_317/m.877 type:complete len:172 (+) Transcript_317:32-547(+)
MARTGAAARGQRHYSNNSWPSDQVAPPPFFVPLPPGLVQATPPERTVGSTAATGRSVLERAEQPGAAASIPSIGSCGHPISCGKACKYSWKARGCKDGVSCIRCHLCKWRRSVNPDKSNSADEQEAAAAPTGNADGSKGELFRNYDGNKSNIPPGEPLYIKVPVSLAEASL